MTALLLTLRAAAVAAPVTEWGSVEASWVQI